MLPLKHVTKNHRLKSLFSSIPTFSIHHYTPHHDSSSFFCLPSTKPQPPIFISQNDVAATFKTWFNTRQNSQDPLLLRIYQILSSSGNDFSSSLASLSLPLSESFVLNVLLRYGNDHGDILSCLKFFDWAGRQPYFYHTRTTFVAIFRILTRANLMPLVLDFLHTFRKGEYAHRVRFNDTLVIGYAIAGKPDIALHLFGKMRFHGLDLDGFGYHVLLTSLAENNYFNAFDVIVNQIRMRGYETSFTHALVVKCLCNKGLVDEAEKYLNDLVECGKELHGSEITFLVNALCETNRFKRALELIRRFGGADLMVPLEHAYSVCVQGLVKGGRLDEALEFFREKRDSEGYVPSTTRYNMLIWKLLRKNRLREVYDLLMDMNESCIPPNTVTMSAVLCFFCKAGMMDVACELYNARSQYGMSPNHMAYKYLVLSLCWDGSVKEAYSVVRSSVTRGYFPDRQTFTTLANSLCRECMIDEMKEFIHLALGRNIRPTASTYDKFISALCRAGRVEDGYLLHGELNNSIAVGASYGKMIRGFIRSNRGDIAARLLVEMKEKGHFLARSLCRVVVCSLLDMDNPRTRVFNLLDMLTQCKPDVRIFNYFIDGVGHAKKVELAREVFDLMLRSDIVPNMSTHSLMLTAYLKSGRTADAVNLFNGLRYQGLENTKLYNSMINGLCIAGQADLALKYLFDMLNAGLNPNLQCYENLVQKLCALKKYYEAIKIVNGYMKVGRRMTTWLGNNLLFHSLMTPELYDIFVHLRGAEDQECSGISLLIFIIGAFSGRLRVNHSVEDLEELIAICFPPNIHTYNLLLRKVISYDMDKACEWFDRIRQKGHEPNFWTYHKMVDGFSHYGREDDARRWIEEMYQKGFEFHPTQYFRRV